MKKLIGEGTPERVVVNVAKFDQRLQRKLGKVLSGGEQQMLAIARARMTNPALLLLHEPLEGLAPIIVEELASALNNLLGIATGFRSPSRRWPSNAARSIVHRARSADFARDAETL